MGRVFVVEARRLFPLLFLLLLLVGLSVYDNFRHQPASPVFEAAEEDELTFNVIDRGKMEDRFQARVLYEKDDFLRVAQEFGLELPEYPFQPTREVAVFVINGTLKKAQLVPMREGNQLRITVDKTSSTYDLITLDRDALEAAGEWYWVFADGRGNVLSQLPGVPLLVDDMPEDEEEDEETMGITK